MLDRIFHRQGDEVRWTRRGSGPPLVFCHGTPWSAALWAPIAERLSDRFTVHLWDMPGYGTSTMADGQDVSLDVQGRVLADLLDHWQLDEPPQVVAHDYGGAVALRAHLLHGAVYRSLTLVDVVALAPWGSDFFRLVAEHAAVFGRLPAPLHEAGDPGGGAASGARCRPPHPARRPRRAHRRAPAVARLIRRARPWPPRGHGPPAPWPPPGASRPGGGLRSPSGSTR